MGHRNSRSVADKEDPDSMESVSLDSIPLAPVKEEAVGRRAATNSPAVSAMEVKGELEQDQARPRTSSPHQSARSHTQRPNARPTAAPSHNRRSHRHGKQQTRRNRRRARGPRRRTRQSRARHIAGAVSNQDTRGTPAQDSGISHEDQISHLHRCLYQAHQVMSEQSGTLAREALNVDSSGSLDPEARHSMGNVGRLMGQAGRTMAWVGQELSRLGVMTNATAPSGIQVQVDESTEAVKMSFS
ncbi:hypothetical protein JX266_008659 [Neoarthrinium moseri]|nr:hypothetical protein JX266_008659 [Neoarthrinium moseri]